MYYFAPLRSKYHNINCLLPKRYLYGVPVGRCPIQVATTIPTYLYYIPYLYHRIYISTSPILYYLPIPTVPRYTDLKIHTFIRSRVNRGAGFIIISTSANLIKSQSTTGKMQNFVRKIDNANMTSNFHILSAWCELIKRNFYAMKIESYSYSVNS